MGLRFIGGDREQSFLMAPDVRDWLPENHLAWFVLAAVEEMDLWPFYAAYRVDGKSRPAAGASSPAAELEGYHTTRGPQPPNPQLA